MDFNGKKVLVTGADGFIGSHLTEALCVGGADVTALAMYNSFDSFGWLDHIPAETRAALRIARGDIRDVHQMTELCRGQDAVFHLAALVSVPYSYDTPQSFVETNLGGTTNVLTAARDADVAIVVNTSTSEIYGTARKTPINEEHPLQGQSPYAASKIGADMMAQAFARCYGLPVVTLRPFNTYGPRQSERAVISTIIRQALDPRCEAIRIGALSPKRDFNFVADIVGAFAAVAALTDEYAGRTFNAGSGVMVTIGEAARTIQAISGCNKPIEEEPARVRPAQSEVMALMADATALHEKTGWTPGIAFEQGLSRTIDWWRDRLHDVRADTTYLV
jgi:UDP-glucose 4-epimerase